MSAGLTLLLMSGILLPEEALAGFANQGMLTVAVLNIVVSGQSYERGHGTLCRHHHGGCVSLFRYAHRLSDQSDDIQRGWLPVWEFVRIGVSLTLLVGLVTVGLVPLIWEF